MVLRITGGRENGKASSPASPPASPPEQGVVLLKTASVILAA
jgi:hypothetical protein